MVMNCESFPADETKMIIQVTYVKT